MSLIPWKACPSCRTKKIEVAAPGRVQAPGWWVICEKCQRAWRLGDGKIDEGMSVGTGQPEGNAPAEGNRQQRRARKRVGRKADTP